MKKSTWSHLAIGLLMLGAAPTQAAFSRAAGAANLGTSLPAGTPAAPLLNPALGGVSLSPQLPGLTPLSLTAPSLIPAAPALSGLPEAAIPASALESAQGLGAAIEAAAKDGPAAPQQAFDTTFDGSVPQAEASDLGGGNDDGGAGNGGSGNDNGGNNGNNDDGGKLGKLYPRVVMILDTLSGPASDKLVSRIETLVQSGVHVVFVTARPEKGEDSADSLLVSRLKVRTGNPVIVVSYNGARISARSSRAENPKPLIEDLGGFADNTIARFQKTNETVKAALGLKGKLAEFSVPSEENRQIYGAELPKGTDMAAFTRAYNDSLRRAGLKYKIEAGVRADGTPYFITQATALKLNTTRLFNGLYAQYPELRQTLKNDEILVLADSTKASSFLKSLPGKGYYIHGVTDGASLETALGAVLGQGALDKVSVIRSKLRSYTDWVEARAKYGASTKGGQSGGGGRVMPASHSRYYRDLGFYRGILIYDIMGRLYHFMRKGQYAEASPEAAENLLNRMWYNPRAMGVRISDDMEAVRHTGRWKSLQRGYLETSKVWLRNYYKRNFKDFPNGVSEKVVGTMINLSRDSKNGIVLEYASPFTGRRYMVHLLPARAHLERDDKGNLLVAHVYRSGKEPFEDEFEDSIEMNLLARAMLQGYADKRPDGHWYVNDEADPRVKVVFHYNTRDLSRIQSVPEIEARAADVTALIEKMLSDKEFQAHWDEQEAKNSKVTAGAAKKAKQKADKKAAKKTK
ncbi:MAG: hypothetical protein AAB320_09580 [Elusimicrobiota bacterium]